MAGEYGINLNLRIKNQSGLDRLNSKVKELTKSVDNIRQIDIMNPRNTGGAFGKKARDQLRKYRQDMDNLVKSVNKSKGVFGKTTNQQIAAADALEEFANSLEIGTKAHKEALAASNRQAKAIGRETKQILENTKAQNENNKSQAQGNKLNDRSTGSALKSGLVSGAFPLLFGQGVLGGLTGFAGGFVGTKMGGQMGGFAGGLVATALLQQLTTLKSALDELGGSFNEINPNIDKLTESLGLAGTAEGERLKMIERTQGAHVALALATEKMNMMIGEEGVKNLREFSEMSKAAGNNFKIGMLKLQAFTASVANFLSKTLGFKQRIEKRTIDEGIDIGVGVGNKEALAIKAEQARIDALPRKQITLKGRSGIESTVFIRNEEARLAQEELDKRKKAFKTTADQIELDKKRQMRLDEGLKSITDQNKFLQNQINLGKQGAEIEKLKAEMANEMTVAVEDLKPLQVEQIEDAVKLKNQLQQQLEITEAIGQTFKDNFTDAIMGATSFRDAMVNILNTIKRKLIETQIDRLFDSARSRGRGGGGIGGLLGGLFGGRKSSGGGSNFGSFNLGINKPSNFLVSGLGGLFANGGRPPVGKASLVGERGAELFVPRSSGTIIPNNQLGGSTTNIVNVSVDASGSSVSGNNQDAQALGAVIGAAVQAQLVKEKRPGGLLTR